MELHDDWRRSGHPVDVHDDDLRRRRHGAVHHHRIASHSVRAGSPACWDALCSPACDGRQPRACRVVACPLERRLAAGLPNRRHLTMSILFAPLAAMAGAIAGSAAHELTHAIVAVLVGGRVEKVGWTGGLTGGPVVLWRSPDESTWRPRAVGLAPFALGVVAAVTALLRPPNGYAAFGVAGFVLALLWSSPEDFSLGRSRQTHDKQT